MSYRTRLVVQSLLAIAAFAVSYAAIDGGSSAGRLLMALLLGVAVAVAVAHVLARGQRRTAERLSAVARALAAGELSVRPSLNAPGELGDVADALRGVAEQLGARIDALQTEDALLSAVIESLNEGVLVLSAPGDVVRINHVGRELLGVGEASLPVSIDSLPREASLHRAIQAALRGTATGPIEVQLGSRRLALTATPLRQRGGSAVVALFDLTQLRRLEQIRQDFVANVSHELRTPLTVVTGFAETLAEDDPDPVHRRQFAKAILSHTGRMQRIVDDLLDLSRIESGGWVPHPEVLNLRELCAEVLSSLEPLVAEKGLALQLTAEDDSDAYVDRTAVRQILSNLVENSVRHTETGEIVVLIERSDAGTWLRVRDTGVGIPTDHLSRIFERFYRADTARTRQRGGTGLGLAIVKHLAESHGGGVRAESEPGKGTTISVFFPSTSAQLELLKG